MLSDILKVALIFLIAVALLAGASFFVLRITVIGNEIEVPNVIGKSFIDAARIMDENDLYIVIEGEKYSATSPKGEVLTQDPVPKHKVKPERVVKVFLSRGTEQGRIPRLIGYPVSDVEPMLASYGLEVGSVIKVHSDDFPQAEVIIAHTPPPDATAQWGSKVDLLVSLGPHSVTLTMPDLKGMEQQKALETLTQIGLKQGYITREPSPEGKRIDVVLKQFPSPNDRVKRGSIVDLVVSSGEVSAGASRTVLLSSYIVPPRPKTKEELEDLLGPWKEDLSPRSVRLELIHDGATQPTMVSKSGPPGARISHVWRRVRGIAVLKIHVDNISTETRISKPPSTGFVIQE